MFLQEVNRTIASARLLPELASAADEVARGMEALENVTAFLLELQKQGRTEEFLADATLYLELTGILTIGWQWLIQGLSAMQALKLGVTEKDSHFYEGKLQVLRYFAAYELPRMDGLARVIKNSRGLTTRMETRLFED